MITVVMEVPGDCALLSSYYAWNAFLDHVIERGRIPVAARMAGWMFQQPLLKHPADDIQAVIPYIDPAWISGINALTIEGRSRDEPICSGAEHGPRAELQPAAGLLGGEGHACSF